MSVIVTDGMSIDHALKLLWREANRENIPNEIQKQQFRVKQTDINHEQKKVWEKQKRRRRSARRKLRRKGQFKLLS
jgi:ribosomal protein S21